jgi:hypothetical protein
VKSSIVWAGVALVAIVAAIGLGLSFAGWTDQAVIGWTAGIGTFAGSVFALLLKVEGKTDAQTQQLTQISDTMATVERRTNGELDARIEAGMRRAADLVLAELRKQGVIS